ncbi:hypothetical protein KP509_16G075400 [Ceratopteris richardii]|uniref:Late embryogenesis abundant protein LEA-2 subgroup domain-containing protein n=1 Tax=Ceratopteris richardii TaxID=49495 RepID=A0A8T2T5R8_CERRI|nr:hypothetical protein KP509_16G075400 [Ceratopteris richardii]
MTDRRGVPWIGSADPAQFTKHSYQAAYATGRPPPHYYHRRQRSGCRKCCWCICASTFTFLLVFFVAASVIYLILNPKSPDFSMERAYVKAFNLTARPVKPEATRINGIDFYLQTDMNFTVQVSNPNKKIGVDFEHVDVGLGYGGIEAGKGTLLPFLLSAEEKKTVDLQLKGQDAALPKAVGMDLQNEMANNSTSMQVETLARVRLRFWGYRTKAFKTLLICNVILTKPIPQENASIRSTSCRFKFLSLMQ